MSNEDNSDMQQEEEDEKAAFGEIAVHDNSDKEEKVTTNDIN